MPKKLKQYLGAVLMLLGTIGIIVHIIVAGEAGLTEYQAFKEYWMQFFIFAVFLFSGSYLLSQGDVDAR